MTFFDITDGGNTETGGTEIGTGTVTDNVLSGTATFTNTGTRKLVARYSGSDTLNASTSATIEVTVTEAV